MPTPEPDPRTPTTTPTPTPRPAYPRGRPGGGGGGGMRNPGRPGALHQPIHAPRGTLFLLSAALVLLGGTAFAYSVLNNTLITLFGVLVTFALLVQFASFLSDVDRDRPVGTSFLALHRRRFVEVVVEATGSAEGFAIAARATLPRGTLVLKSTVADRAQVDLAPLVIHEITVVGSRCGSFEPALRALESGSVEVRPLISARVPLDRADDALREAARPGVLKVLVTR